MKCERRQRFCIKSNELIATAKPYNTTSTPSAISIQALAERDQCILHYVQRIYFMESDLSGISMENLILMY